MKKIIFLLSLFLLCIGSVSAQPEFVVSPEPQNGKFAEGTRWYFIQFANKDAYHTNGYLGTKGDDYINNNGVLLLNGTTKPLTKYGLWCRVGNETDGYKFYNRGTGAGKVLGISKSDGLAKMYNVNDINDNIYTNFDYLQSSSSLAGGPYAAIKAKTSKEDDYPYWNNSDGAPKCHLTIWNASGALSDNGSAISITEVSPEELREMSIIDVAVDIKSSDAPSDGNWAENTVWYYILHGNGGYVSPADGYADEQGLLLTNQTKIFSEDLFWCIVGNEKEGYKFYNRGKGTKYFIGITGSEANARTKMYNETGTNTDVTTTFDFTDSNYGTGNVSISKHLSGNDYWNMRGNYLALWKNDNATNATNGQGSAFKFIPITENLSDIFSDIVTQAQTALTDNANATYFNLSDDDKQALEDAIEAADGMTIDQAFAAQKALLNTKGRINATFEDGTQLIFGNLQHTGRYMGIKSGSNNGQLGSPTTMDWTTVWTLKEAEGGLYKFYNEYIDKYIGAIPGTNDTPISLVEESEATAYSIYASPKVGYCLIADLKYNTKDRQNFHMVNWDGIVRWNDISDASQFKPIAFTDELATEWSENLISSTSGAGKIGYKENTEDLKSALAELERDMTNKEAYRAVESAWAAASLVHPKADKYYTIRNATQDTKFMTESYGSDLVGGKTQVTGETQAANIVPTLWRFEKAEPDNDQLYYITSANSGLCLRQSVYGQQLRVLSTEDEEAGKYTVFNTDNRNVAGAVTLVSFYGNNTKGTARLNDNGGIDSYNANVAGNNWFVEEVSNIPVTITDARYATLNLPFAVQIPENSVITAYTAADEGNVVELHKIEGSLIPANTPVILEGDKDTYTLTIAYENNGDPTITKNALSGTTVPEEIDASDNLYILKKGQSGIVGMYLVTTDDRTVGANKAYLLSNGAAEAKAFSFGGTTTGITSAPTADAADGVYYDLRGRLVAYPSHGVYVKSNGQKVLVK